MFESQSSHNRKAQPPSGQELNPWLGRRLAGPAMMYARVQGSRPRSPAYFTARNILRADRPSPIPISRPSFLSKNQPFAPASWKKIELFWLRRKARTLHAVSRARDYDRFDTDLPRQIAEQDYRTADMPIPGPRISSTADQERSQASRRPPALEKLSVPAPAPALKESTQTSGPADGLPKESPSRLTAKPLVGIPSPEKQPDEPQKAVLFPGKNSLIVKVEKSGSKTLVRPVWIGTVRSRTAAVSPSSTTGNSGGNYPANTDLTSLPYRRKPVSSNPVFSPWIQRNRENRAAAGSDADLTSRPYRRKPVSSDPIFSPWVQRNPENRKMEEVEVVPQLSEGAPGKPDVSGETPSRKSTTGTIISPSKTEAAPHRSVNAAITVIHSLASTGVQPQKIMMDRSPSPAKKTLSPENNLITARLPDGHSNAPRITTPVSSPGGSSPENITYRLAAGAAHDDLGGRQIVSSLESGLVEGKGALFNLEDLNQTVLPSPAPESRIDFPPGSGLSEMPVLREASREPAGLNKPLFTGYPALNLSRKSIVSMQNRERAPEKYQPFSEKKGFLSPSQASRGSTGNLLYAKKEPTSWVLPMDFPVAKANRMADHSRPENSGPVYRQVSGMSGLTSPRMAERAATETAAMPLARMPEANRAQSPAAAGAAAAEGGAKPDLKALAREIYPLIKRMIVIDRERLPL